MRSINRQYINGQFVESHGREWMEIVNPTNGRAIARVTLADEEDTRRAIAAAKRAFPSFSRTTKEQRSQYLHRLHDVVVARLDDHVAAMIEEYGGSLQFSQATCRLAAQCLLSAADALGQLELTKLIGQATVTLEPLGVAGLISPWNGSIAHVCWKLASALAAGCTTVIKPSELSAVETEVLLECFHDAKLPPGVLNVLIGTGPVVGAEITRNPDVAKVSFTGSTAVGKTVARDGAATMKRFTLELGGKSPNILLDDVDLDQAIPAALGLCFMNSGQACVAATRLLVPETRLEEVKAAIVKAIPMFKVGDPADADTAIGPMVTRRQYERIQRYIRKGIEEGAEVLVGGEGHPGGLEQGYFVRPTVFTGVTNGMTIAQEEIFGPVLCVLTYKTEEEALAIANDTPYGLYGYVSGTDIERATRVASRIEAGRVAINGFPNELLAPFGGFKQSGVGRDWGTYGIEGYLEPKAVLR